MVPATPPANPSDVPQMVFEKFIAEMTNSNVAPEVVARLRKALIEDQDFTDSALRLAVFGEDPSP